MTIKRLTTLSAGLAMAVLMAIVALAPPAHAALGLRDTADAAPWTTNGIVYASALSEDGQTLYIGGKFTQVRPPAGAAGQALSVGRVAAIDVDTGAPIRTWNPNVTSNDGTAPVVRSLAVRGGRVYVGGQFTTVGGQAHRNLAAVDATTGAVAGSFAPTVGDSTSTVFALAADSSRLYVGGQFASVNGTGRANLVALNPSTGATDNAWRARANRVVRALAFGPNDDGTLFVVGGFNSISYPGDPSSPYARQSVARLDAATGNVHPWAIPAGQVQTDSGRNNNMTCWAETVTQSRIFVDCGLGPNFTAAYRLDNGNSGDRIWSRGFGGNPQASAMSPDGTRLIVGGHFGINPIKQQVCGEPLGGLVALDPANGAIDCSSNWVPHLDQNRDPSYDGAWSVLSTDEHVWVGGGFVGVSGEPRTNLARFTYDPTLKVVNAAPRVDLDGLQRGGLDATYYDNQNFSGTQVRRTDPSVDFNWGNGSPDPSIGADTFSTRWMGQVEAPVSGDYTFTTNTDDGVRLFVDGKQVIDAWRDRGPTDDSATVTLEVGRRYDIQMDYYENGGGAVARLHWSYPGQARQAVPSSNLFNGGNLDHSATFAAGSGPSAIVSNALAVTDADDANIRSAKVTLAGNADGASERLSVDAAGTPISAGYDAQAGVLSLEGSASKAAYQQVLRTAAYDNTCANPTAGDRQARFVINDGSVDSEAATSTVAVQASGDPGGGCSGLSVQAPTRDLSLANSTVGASTVPVKILWSASDEDGVASYEVQQSTDGGAYQDVSLGSDTTRTQKNFQLEPGGEYQFRVRATDDAGNTGAWAEGQRFTVDAQQQETAGVLAYSGGWAEQSLSTAFGGSTTHSSEAGETATLTFEGTDVSWVAQRGPDRGRAEVRLDGELVETVDLYNASAQPRRVLYSASLDSAGPHTLEVRVLGTKRAASTGTRVDVDAFLTLR